MLLVEWAGWYNKGTSDKIWGIIRDGQGERFNFWCRRGAKMQFKATSDGRFSHKVDKGYQSITVKKLEAIYPGFMQEAEQQLIFKKLTGNVL